MQTFFCHFERFRWSETNPFEIIGTVFFLLQTRSVYSMVVKVYKLNQGGKNISNKTHNLKTPTATAIDSESATAARHASYSHDLYKPLVFSRRTPPPQTMTTVQTP